MSVDNRRVRQRRAPVWEFESRRRSRTNFRCDGHYGVEIGQHVLAVSISPFDPIQTFTGSKLDVDFFVIQLGLLMFSGANAGGPDNN